MSVCVARTSDVVFMNMRETRERGHVTCTGTYHFHTSLGLLSACQ